MPRETSATCEECGKVVSRKSDLQRHMQTHALNKEELMHRCPFMGCNFKTLQLSNIKTHENIHTGSKPHKCSRCSYRCGDPSSLLHHQKSIHGCIAKSRARNQPAAGVGGNLSPNASSSSPGEGSRSSGPSIDPSMESYKTPWLASKMLDLYSSSLPPSECCTKDSAKPSSPAFDTLLTQEHGEGNNGQSLPNPGGVSSSLDLPVGPIPRMVSDELTSSAFDKFLSQWDSLGYYNGAPASLDNLEAEVAPMHQHPPDSVSVANSKSYTLVNTPAQSYLGYNYALESSTPYLEPMGIPSHGGYIFSDGHASLDPYGYAVNEALFNAQFSQGYSFGVPDINKGYQYPTVGSSSFPYYY